MLGQGSSIINTAYFDALKVRANGIRSCEDLQAFTSEVMGSLNANVAAINQQLAMLQPILALLKPPAANPAEIVSWLTNFITAFLTPYAKPAVVYVAQVAAVMAAMAELQSLLQSKSMEFPGCSIAMPDLPKVELPQVPSA
ncbi:hypothetical protein [Dyella sp. 2RAB6]|uniref:hypothetical protein n=1 Tax=Dyella sp. 2RAB6 TaxID=3232992 RepID=UPI003F923AAB